MRVQPSLILKRYVALEIIVVYRAVKCANLFLFFSFGLVVLFLWCVYVCICVGVGIQLHTPKSD